MEIHANRSAMLERRRPTAVRWVKEWVEQEVVATGGKCLLLKWVTEDTLRRLREKPKETTVQEKEPEPTTEHLFLCSYEGCGKTFIDVGALKKHAHVHGERQHVCQHEGCGKKFLDSSKLKRHYLIHTGEKAFACPHDGCGKAFSLDFNLKAHMKTHSLENYHVCPYPDCGKRYTHEIKLKSHIKSHHEKKTVMDMKRSTPAEKPQSTQKATTVAYGASVERPYACPYEGCGKAYIHEYKLNLHLRREHPDHNIDANAKPTAGGHAAEMTGDQDAYIAKGGATKSLKRKKSDVIPKMPAAKVPKGKSLCRAPPISNTAAKQQCPSIDVYDDDSEETEEDRDDVDDERWRYQDVNVDDEETEDEE